MPLDGYINANEICYAALLSLYNRRDQELNHGPEHYQSMILPTGHVRLCMFQVCF